MNILYNLYGIHINIVCTIYIYSLKSIKMLYNYFLKLLNI